MTYKNNFYKTTHNYPWKTHSVKLFGGVSRVDKISIEMWQKNISTQKQIQMIPFKFSFFNSLKFTNKSYSFSLQKTTSLYSKIFLYEFNVWRNWNLSRI